MALILERHKPKHMHTLQREAKRIFYLCTAHPGGLNEEPKINSFLLDKLEKMCGD